MFIVLDIFTISQNSVFDFTILRLVDISNNLKSFILVLNSSYSYGTFTPKLFTWPSFNIVIYSSSKECCSIASNEPGFICDITVCSDDNMSIIISSLALSDITWAW